MALKRKKTAKQNKTNVSKKSGKRTARTRAERKTGQQKNPRIKAGPLKGKVKKKQKPQPHRQSEMSVPIINAGREQAPPVPVDNKKHPDGYWQDRYQDDRLVVLVRDPFWLLAYWDLSPKIEDAIKKAEAMETPAKPVLRIFKVSGNQGHEPGESVLDIGLNPEADNWYVQVPESNCAYRASFGILSREEFKPLLWSNVVSTPADKPAPLGENEESEAGSVFERLYKEASEAGTSPGFSLYKKTKVRSG